MTAHKIFGAILACAAATAVVPGCATGGAYVAYDEPPPARDEIVVARPGYIWAHGHWSRDSGSWHWHPGHYERDRFGQRYVEGHWNHHGDRSVYVEGAWRRT